MATCLLLSDDSMSVISVTNPNARALPFFRRATSCFWPLSLWSRETPTNFQTYHHPSVLHLLLLLHHHPIITLPIEGPNLVWWPDTMTPMERSSIIRLMWRMSSWRPWVSSVASWAETHFHVILMIPMLSRKAYFVPEAEFVPFGGLRRQQRLLSICQIRWI